MEEKDMNLMQKISQTYEKYPGIFTSLKPKQTQIQAMQNGLKLLMDINLYQEKFSLMKHIFD